MAVDPYIGKMLDNRYEILERIGTGGMAVVYKARCHLLNRLVAIKILKSDLAQDEDFRRRFNAESKAVARLSHPNIVSVYDVSRGGDMEYIVMELIDGITLKQYMEKRGKLNWREALHFITQIMRGLSHAHSRSIVHRDIKPQNVMVLRDGSVKVADFGIACLENSSQTLTQEALGSVHYISPEQARGDRTDARSDVYSAGVVLYEMLTNRLPFEGDSAVSVAIQHLSAIPLAPREIDPEIPEQLELICMKAMAPDLDKRYPSADAMIADLEAFRKNPSVNLDFELDDLKPMESDEPTRLIHTGSYTPSGSSAHHSTDHQPEHIREREEEPAPSGGKKRTGVIVGVCIAALLVLFFLFRSIFGSFGGPAQEHIVPNVIGYTVEQAGELAGIKDIFTIKVAGTEQNDEYAAGVIIRQSPEQDRVKKGDNLVMKVWISSGVGSGAMPGLIDQDVRIARQALKELSKDLDLEIEEIEEFSDEYEEGHVISTIPAEGETLEKGDTVQLIISKGPESKDVPVPSFAGQKIDKVRTEIGNVWSLKIGKEIPVPSDEPEGVIVGQSVDANTMVPSGTVIDFDVSIGPEAESATISIGCDLPTDRETVQLTVLVNGEVQYDENVECAKEYVPVSITGSGTQVVTILWDGTEQYRFEQQFTS